MDKKDASTRMDAALWRRVRQDWRAQAGAVELPGAPETTTEMAAYLDGRLEGAGLERMETRLAASPEALDLALAARDALAAGSAPAPASLLARARALAADPATDPATGPATGPAAWAAGSPAWLLALLAPWRNGAHRAAVGFAAAALLLASVAGFELGRSGYAHSAAVENLMSEAIDFGLGQDLDDIL